MAAAAGHTDIVSHLLRHRANPYLTASELQWDRDALAFVTALPGTAGNAHDVARFNQRAETAKLLDNRQRRDQKVLCQEAAAGKLTAAKLALVTRRSMCHVHYADEQGRTLLHWLAARNSSALIEQLLAAPEAGVLLERPDRLGQTPLDIACRSTAYDAALVLLAAGARAEPHRNVRVNADGSFEFSECPPHARPPPPWRTRVG